MRESRLNEEPALLTRKDLARLFQVSLRTISRWQTSSAIPDPVRIGGSLRWRREDVTDWIVRSSRADAGGRS